MIGFVCFGAEGVSSAGAGGALSYLWLGLYRGLCVGSENGFLWGGEEPLGGLCVLVTPPDVSRAEPYPPVGRCASGGVSAWSIWAGVGSGLPGWSCV